MVHVDIVDRWSQIRSDIIISNVSDHIPSGSHGILFLWLVGDLSNSIGSGLKM